MHGRAEWERERVRGGGGSGSDFFGCRRRRILFAQLQQPPCAVSTPSPNRRRWTTRRLRPTRARRRRIIRSRRTLIASPFRPATAARLSCDSAAMRPTTRLSRVARGAGERARRFEHHWITAAHSAAYNRHSDWQTDRGSCPKTHQLAAPPSPPSSAIRCRCSTACCSRYNDLAARGAT